MSNPVESQQAYLALYAAIQQNKSPSLLLYEFLQQPGVIPTGLTNYIVNNKQILQLITSPKGRVWLKNHVDEFLDYLAILGA